jgi:F-type H+/Na+-transporting ATPase subunit alpha
MDLFNQYLQQTNEYGVVIQVSHPIVFIEGLPSVKTHEIILFETGQKAEVFAINRGKIEARVFSHDPIKVGTKVTRSNQLLSLPVGRELMGHVINPLGEPLDPTVTFTKPKEIRDLEAKPIGISGRQKIATPLATGISLIDLMVPLGRGQRELIIGDRKTGKTSILLTAIKKQVEEGVIAIYVAIAKKKSDIKKIQEFFEQEKIMDKIIIVATSSYDSPSLIYQTPYAGMSIAEYFRDQGVHSLLILDDLSTHAKFYRELSLLARRFPGRDSYPGDIFYAHSRLLERAGNFKHPTAKEVSITCLPVIEIVEGDFTGYVATNVMGITDGHIYLDSNMYYQGMRPAVNIPLSVTRVGRQTLDKLSREVNKELTSFLSEYDKLLNLSHFGQELTEDVKKKLHVGEIIYKFFNQPYQQTIPKTIQLIILSLIMQDAIANKEMLEKVKKGLMNAFFHEEPKKWLMELAVAENLKIFTENITKNKDKLLLVGQEHHDKDPQSKPAAAGDPTAQALAKLGTQPAVQVASQPQAAPPAAPVPPAPPAPAAPAQTTPPTEEKTSG